jgi:hypothetical protein
LIFYGWLKEAKQRVKVFLETHSSLVSFGEEKRGAFLEEKEAHFMLPS